MSISASMMNEQYEEHGHKRALIIFTIALIESGID